MSDSATAWAKANPCQSINARTGELEGDRNAKHVLVDMAAYADVEGFVWAAIPVLAVECEISERMVQRGIAALIKNGLLEETERRQLWRGKWFPIYRMPIEKGYPNTRARLQAEHAASLRVTPVSPVAGDDEFSGDTGVTPTGDTGDGPGVTPVSPKEIPIESPIKTPSAGVRAGEPIGGEGGEAAPDPFDQVLTAWLAAEVRAKAGRTSPGAARQAWDEAVAGLDPAQMARAALAALAADVDFRRRGPPALERWLGKGLFSAWMAEVATARPSSGPIVEPDWPAPPADLRTAFVAAFTDAKANSWWPIGWIEDRRLLVARTTVAKEWLLKNARSWLQSNDLSVISAAEARQGLVEVPHG